jgi:hypothetical protein
MTEQCFSGWSQDQSAPGFNQYRHSDLLFEFLQLGANGGRGATEAIRRFGKAVELHARDKGAQDIEIEGGAAHSIVH